MAARDRVARLAGSAAVDRLGRADRRRRMGARILPSYHALRALDGGEDHEQQWAAVGSSGVAVGSSGAAVARQWCSSGAAVVQQWRGSGAATLKGEKAINCGPRSPPASGASCRWWWAAGVRAALC